MSKNENVQLIVELQKQLDKRQATVHALQQRINILEKELHNVVNRCKQVKQNTNHNDLWINRSQPGFGK